MSPLAETPIGYGVGSGPGSWYSLKVWVFGSNRATLPALNSSYQIMPSGAITIRRGAPLGVGETQVVALSVFGSILPILFAPGAVIHTSPVCMSTLTSYVLGKS